MLMKTRTLHLIEDDWFIEYAINFFDRSNHLENDYVLLRKIGRQEGARLKGIHNTIKIRTIIFGSDDYYNLIEEVSNNYKNVVVHYLTDEKAHFINRVKVKNFTWIVWGGDAYSHPELLTDIYEKETLRMSGVSPFLINNRILYKYYYQVGVKIHNYLHVIKYLKKHPSYEYYESLRKFNYCFILTNAEEKTYKQILSKNVVFKKFSYGSLEDHIIGTPEALDLKFTRNNILLGNSGTPSNNHLDVFLKLSHIDLEDRLVIVPLSYGDISYSNKILELGRCLLGKNFYPLTEYMPKEKYNNLVSSCGIVIMNHRRQQGLGNILSQLWMGAKIFLNPLSPIYDEFLKQKVVVFNTNEIDSKALVYDGPYNSREKLMNLFSKINADKKLEELEKILK